MNDDIYKDIPNTETEERITKTQEIEQNLNEETSFQIDQKEYCTPDFEQFLIETMQQGNDFLQTLNSNFPDDVPIFSQSFFKEFVSYFMEKKPNFRELLSIFLCSNPENVTELVNCGIINKTLIQDCPDAFDPILDILTKAPTPKAISSFVSNSGCYQLARFSNNPEFQEKIVRILEIVSQSDEIEYGSSLFPPIWDIDFDSDDPIGDFPDFYMNDLFNNLLQSNDINIVYATLDLLKPLFKQNKAVINTFGDRFLENYCKNPTEDPELNLKTIQTLTSAFKNGLNVNIKPMKGVAYHMFLQLRGIIESIISDPNASDELISASVDCITSLLSPDARVEGMHAFDIFKDTEIIPTMISRCSYCQFKSRRSIVLSLCTILDHSTRSERKQLVSMGAIGALCEFVSSVHDDTIFTILNNITTLIVDMSLETLSDEESEQITSIQSTLEDLMDSDDNLQLKLKAEEVYKLFDALFSHETEDKN